MISYEDFSVHLGRIKQFLRNISRPLAVLPGAGLNAPPLPPRAPREASSHSGNRTLVPAFTFHRHPMQGETSDHSRDYWLQQSQEALGHPILPFPGAFCIYFCPSTDHLVVMKTIHRATPPLPTNPRRLSVPCEGHWLLCISVNFP